MNVLGRRMWILRFQGIYLPVLREVVIVFGVGFIIRIVGVNRIIFWDIDVM